MHPQVVFVVLENLHNQASFLKSTRIIANLILHITSVSHLQGREVALFTPGFMALAKSLLQGALSVVQQFLP